MLSKRAELLLRYFDCSGLPMEVRKVAEHFNDLARFVAERAPDHPQTLVSLQSLLNARDAAVRAMHSVD